ncbi:MAG: pilus assembly protein PilZ [Gracilibacter sp. BRH_c7a]|nr:MAG: pilus assembly protein PilZ [Gracilibacter sp. BRH_c7a]
MRYQNKLFEGQPVEIVISEGEYQGRYKTKVEELGVRIISIGIPIDQGMIIPLREGTNLDVVFSDELSAYTFSSVIIKRIAAPIPTLILEFPSKITKIQRRQYVRVELVTPIEYQVLQKEGLSKANKGYVVDLSGGGISFKAKDELLLNTIIIIKTIIGGVSIELPAAVVRSIKKEDDNEYNISAEFQEISENIRDKIIQYIFDIQRERRKKGLI